MGFSPVGSFGIDKGELDGLTPQLCFVLGYELSQIDTLLTRPEAFERPVHADNRQRIERRCRRAKRKHSLEWMPDDKSENWLNLKVGAA